MASITIPYAVADFIEMRERGFYYVDKTQYIAKLEDYKAPVFLRPRRFGKSLLVSTLACYYDRVRQVLRYIPLLTFRLVHPIQLLLPHLSRYS